jgi:hypothetical protein
VHRAAHLLAPSTLGYGLSDSPAGLLAWILERWMHWPDNGGDVYSVFTRDDLPTHATIYWTGNAIASSIRTYANNNRYPWTPSHDRTPVVEALTGITFVDYENPRESTARTSASSRFWPATALPGTTTSTSPSTPAAATSSPGRSPTSGPPTWFGPSSRSSPRRQREAPLLKR